MCVSHRPSDGLFRLTSTTSCDTFVQLKTKALWHMKTGKCIVPQSNSNNARLILTSSCHILNTRFEQTSAFSMRHLSTGYCVHPEGGSIAPHPNTNIVIYSGCDENRLQFKFFSGKQYFHKLITNCFDAAKSWTKTCLKVTYAKKVHFLLCRNVLTPKHFGRLFFLNIFLNCLIRIQICSKTCIICYALDEKKERRLALCYSNFHAFVIIRHTSIVCLLIWLSNREQVFFLFSYLHCSVPSYIEYYDAVIVQCVR